MQVTYHDQTLNFPEWALGGTTAAPKVKPAQELLLNWITEKPELVNDSKVLVCHTPDGVVGTFLADHCSVNFLSDNVRHYADYRGSLEMNGKARIPPITEVRPAIVGALKYGVMCLPKSMDLFESYLLEISGKIKPDFRLAASFQTKHFTPRMISIAEKYATKVSQSRAYKKSRLLMLESFKLDVASEPPLKSLAFRGKAYQQHLGVFSGNHIDYATQFLLDSWRDIDLLRTISPPRNLLDIGIGNGVIGDQLLTHHYPAARLFGTDVSYAAIRSARMNCPDSVELKWVSSLRSLDAVQFDLIVTNPPFHDGHRNTIDPTINLFKQARNLLVAGGYLVVVANRHLNYVTHLEQLFEEVIEVAENQKFVIYRAEA